MDHFGQIPIKSFRGSCFGVNLVKRGPDDPHICFQIIVEDDENWFDREQSNGSSFWIDELIEQLTAAKQYMNANTLPDGQYGFKFKE